MRSAPRALPSGRLTGSGDLRAFYSGLQMASIGTSKMFQGIPIFGFCDSL